MVSLLELDDDEELGSSPKVTPPQTVVLAAKAAPKIPSSAEVGAC